MQPETESLEALAALLWFMQREKEGRTLYEQFAGLVRRHAEAFTAAYPGEATTPKAHVAFHLPPQALRDGVVVDALVGERKHQLLKGVATVVKNNTSAFDQTCVVAAFAKQVCDLDTDMSDGLRAAMPAHELSDSFGAGVELALSARWKGTMLSQGDLFVLSDIDAIFARAFAATPDGRLFIVGDLHARGAQARASHV